MTREHATPEAASASGSDDATMGDAQPVLESLNGGKPPPSSGRWRPLWRAAALLALATLLVVGAVTVWPRAPSPKQQAVAGWRPLPTVTPSIPAGWSRAGPYHASDIAFAPSASYLAYACGPDTAPAGSGSAQPIKAYVSTDTGHTWRLLTPQFTGVPDGGGFWGVACFLSVNPVNPADVVLLDEGSACGGGFGMTLYRSRDGGETWRQETLPAWDSSGEQAQASILMAWTGATLFVAADAPCGTSLNRLAASVSGGAFAWINDDGLFADGPPGATLGWITPAGASLYVRLDSGANCPSNCQVYKRTSDGGASWSVFTSTWQGHQVFPLDAPPNHAARSLFAQVYSDQSDPCTSARTYLRSTDSGATWRALPSLPAGLYIAQVLDAPDGTVYASVESLCDTASRSQQGIYALRPASVAWALVATEPGGYLSLGWDQEGHPTGLWALQDPQAAPFLIYHTP